MTTRQRITKVWRVLGSVMAVGLTSLIAGVIGGVFIDPHWEAAGFFVVGGFLIAVLGGIGCGISGRCASCERKIGNMFQYAHGFRFQVPQELKFCPYCGVNIDTEMSGAPGNAS